MTSSGDELLDEFASTKKEVVGLRTFVAQLRSGQDKDAATFLEYDHRLSSLKMDMMRVSQELSSAFTAKDWKKLKNSMDVATSAVRASVRSDQEVLKEELAASHGESVASLAAWFAEHDGMAAARQTQLDRKVESCARSDELAALKENLEADGERMGFRLKRATVNLQDALQKIQTMKERKAMQTLNLLYQKVRRTFYSGAFNTWKTCLLQHRAATVLAVARDAKTRKVLLHLLMKVYATAVGKWRLYLAKLAVHRAAQKKAINDLRRTFLRFILAPKEDAFRRWFRCTMNDQEEEKARSLGSIINAFQNDAQGAIQVREREGGGGEGGG